MQDVHFANHEAIDPTTWNILMKAICRSMTTTKQEPTTRALFEDTSSTRSLVAKDERLCSLGRITTDVTKAANVTKEVRL